MSLLRLLAAGKSFDGVGDAGTSRYHMRSPNLLPKFGSGKNPFATKAKVDPVKPAPIATTKVKGPGTRQTGASSPAATTATTLPAVMGDNAPTGARANPRSANPFARQESRPLVAPANRSKAIVPTPVVRKPLTPTPARTGGKSGTFGWAKYLNPLSYFPGRESRAARGVRQWPSNKPVQGELSLDNVKVVRNDLSDTDIEVVRVKPVVLTETVAAPVSAVVAPMAKTAPSTWGRFTSRFARVEQEQTQLH